MVENRITRGVKIIVGKEAGACNLIGVTITGSEESGLKKIVSEEDMNFFKQHEGFCKKKNREVGGCLLCTADPTNSDSVSKFCPFEKYPSQE